MEVKTASAGGRAQPRDADRAADGRPAAARRGPARRPRPATTCCSTWRDGFGVAPRDRPAAARHAAAASDYVQPGHRRRPRRLHPVRPLRPRLRRHPGQRRHRPHRQGLHDADRASTSNDPMGESHVRDVRRVRRRLPDRRARPTSRSTACRSARARSSTAVDSVCPYCGVGCALTYHVDDERDAIVFADGRDAARQRSGRLCVKGRYGWDYAASPQRLTTPLIRASEPTRRARCRATCAARAAAAQAAGRARRLRRGPARTSARRRWDEALDLVAAPARARSTPQHGAGRARRLRLGQVLQRGGLPLPEADPRGLRHEQRRPLHAAVPRLERGGAVRGHRLRRGLDDLRRHRQRRRRDPHRHEHDGEPPGRRHVLQAGAPRAARS